VITATLPAPSVAGRSVSRGQWRFALPFLTAAFTYVFFANAWLGDDAYITFRTVWNTLHGYGPVFNPGERVQAFTHPLWFLVMTATYGITREFFFTSLAVSYAFGLAAMLLVARSSRDVWSGVVGILWLLSSKAFVDYTSSGLEYPLSYLLLVLFYVRFCARPGPTWSAGSLRLFGLLAGLAFTNRFDTVLLYAAPLAWVALHAARRRDRSVYALLLPFALPVGLWLLFATIYYGFPLPNTYYAKVATGIPASLMYRQGVAYLLNSFAHDPLTLGTVGIAAALAVRSSIPIRLAAISSLLYVAYTISVGGDFMSGRFFAMPFLVAVLMLQRLLEGVPSSQAAVGAALVLYNLVMPIVPIKTTAAYDAAWPWRSQNGIKDERGHYHRITNVFFYSPFRELPDHTWMREGLSFSQGPDKVTVQGSIGFFGLAAGPDKHVVDRNALADPLLARLPVSPQLYFEFYAGHYFRDMPAGYLDTLAMGSNRLADPVLHEYYDRLKDALSGPLFSAARLRSLWYLNAGDGRDIARRFESRRPIRLSIRAANERFATDAGERDPAAGVIRSNGRPGYLQYGPSIPIKAGVYRVRWIGVVAEGDGGPLGFVDAWDGDAQLARREIAAVEIQPSERRLAELEFVLPRSTTRLEYRIWVDGRRAVTLERVELVSLGPGAVSRKENPADKLRVHKALNLSCFGVSSAGSGC
jgi:arabinofuranosyltransferase